MTRHRTTIAGLFLIFCFALSTAGCESRTTEQAIADAVQKGDSELAYYLTQRTGPRLRERYEVLGTLAITGTAEQASYAMRILIGLPNHRQSVWLTKVVAARTDAATRELAVDCIAYMADPATVPFLLQILADERGEIASAARDAFREIKTSDTCGNYGHQLNHIEHTDDEGIPHPFDSPPRPPIPPITHLPEFTRWWKENKTALLANYKIDAPFWDDRDIPGNTRTSAVAANARY